jgi:hypothetical protein
MLTESEVFLVAEDDSLPVRCCPMLVAIRECEAATEVVFVENVLLSLNSAEQTSLIEAAAYRAS